MRLIDADALLENFHKKRNPQEGADSTNQRHRYMQFLGDCEAIRNAPTIDAVPVIRCKDCKYWEYYDEGDFGITYGGCRSPQWFHTASNGLETTGVDYCSWAERKEE